MVLHLRVQADQLEDDEEDVPVMQLRVSLRLLPGDHLVGCVGEEALEAVEEGVVIARPYLPNELSDLEGGLRGLYARIERRRNLLPPPCSGNPVDKCQTQDHSP